MCKDWYKDDDMCKAVENQKNIMLEAIENQRELLQNDLTCILDGLDTLIVDNACEAVVDRMKILIDKLTK